MWRIVGLALYKTKEKPKPLGHVRHDKAIGLGRWEGLGRTVVARERTWWKG